MTSSNKSHAMTARNVLGSFERIAEMTEHISRQTGTMKETVTELETANADIVENIQKISAITEEVSAHSSEIYNACEENSCMVSEVTGIVEGLHEESYYSQPSTSHSQNLLPRSFCTPLRVVRFAHVGGVPASQSDLNRYTAFYVQAQRICVSVQIGCE